MNVVGKVGSLISQGVYSVATPFHPFGGAVDIIVVQQQDGSFRSAPWYVRFGKFQGVLKGAEKMVRINVNGAEANFHMYLDNAGEAYFTRETDPAEESEGDGVVKDGREKKQTDHNVNDCYGDSLDEASFEAHRLQSTLSDPGVAGEVYYAAMRANRLERTESDACNFYDFQDDHSSIDGSVEFSSEYGSNRYDNLDGMENFVEAPGSDSEMVLVSVDGHILTAPISSREQDAKNLQLDNPQFHLGPGESAEFCEGKGEFTVSEKMWAAVGHADLEASSTKASRAGSVDSADDDGDNSVDQETMGCKDNENVCQEDAGSVNREQALDEVHQLEISRVGGENGHPNGAIADVKSQESDLYAPNGVDDAPVATKSGDGEMKSEISLIDIHEETEEESVRNFQVCDTDNEHLQGNHTISTESGGEVQGGYTDEVMIGKGADSAFSSLDSNVINGEVHPGEEISTHVETFPSDSISNGFDTDAVEKHLTQSQSHDAAPNSPRRDATEDDASRCENEVEQATISSAGLQADSGSSFEISLCRHLLHSGMGLDSAAEAFNANSISAEEFKHSATSIIKDENLVVKFGEAYLPWDKAAPVVLGRAVFGLDLPFEPTDAIPVARKVIEKPKEIDAESVSSPRRRWRLWPIPFRRSKTLEPSTDNISNEDIFLDPEASRSPSPDSNSASLSRTQSLTTNVKSPRKKFVRTNIPTSEQIASLNLKDGRNVVTFSFCTRVWGLQEVEAHIYLWKWNARIVISDVDGTITKSDVLGQFMPLVGRDWTQSGVAKLFCAIKENGYQLLFLSARAIVQAYLTRSFLVNLKQDGKALPNGPVVISPDGLFPSLFREVIRRAPHEFKIACLEDIKALFPPDYNPFYAGFGNRDTDELSYRKIGIPKGKIFIINPKGEVAISHRIDVKSYTSLHTLVNDMFPPTSMLEQEDYNHWNYWKMPIADVDDDL